MAKLTTLSLDELYAKPNKTAAVRAAIVSKTDFSQIDVRYCAEVCTLKCKASSSLRINHAPVDVLIIQDHRAPPGKYDRQVGQQDRIQAGILEQIARLAGLQGVSYRLTSLLKCPATVEDFPNGKPPTDTTLRKCFPYLHEEILRTQPKVIISLATSVTKALGLTKYSNSGDRGEVAISEYGPVVLTLHPRVLAYIRQNARGGMWGPDYMNVVKRDFQKALKIAKGEWTYTNTLREESIEALKREGRIRIASKMEDVQEYMDIIWALPEDAVVSFDTETTSVDPLDPMLRILTIQFGYRDPADGIIKALVIPLWHRKNTFYNADEAWKLVKPWLLSNRPKAGHNAKFDILVLYWATGVRVVNVVFDTLLLLHSVESGIQGCYSLKTACWDHLYEMGFAGYEDDLGDLKALKKQLEAAQGEAHNEGVNLDDELDADFLQRTSED